MTGSSAATAVPYILPAGVLGARPSGGANHLVTGSDASLTIGELIVLGALDTVAAAVLDDEGDDMGKTGVEPRSAAWPRAWISCGKDVEVVCPEVRHDALRSRFLDQSAVTADSWGGSLNMLDVGYRNGLAKHKHRSLDGKLMMGMMMSPAGLPTPPASESSLDGESAASHASGSSEDVETKVVSVEHEAYTRVSVGEARKLRARVANLFGGRTMSDGEKTREGQMGASTRLRRVWGVSRALA